MTDYAIEARALRKTYAAQGDAPPKEALKGVDLKIPTGSVFGLLGPNGAGKSTFINILAGLVNKTSGHVSIWGFDQDANPRQSRASIGVVPQELNLDPFFTPREAVEIQAGLYGVPRRERRTVELLTRLGLGDKLDAYSRTLSGGMRRRLLIAKAMAHNPPVLVLDEPTAGVDIELRRQMWDFVRELNDRGVTIVLTTHYLEEAEEMCDRIAIVNHGAVVACEDKADLLKHIDSKTAVIYADQPILAAPTRLPESVSASLRPDGALSLTYPKSTISLGELLAAVTESGVTVRDIATEEPHLEDVFLELTAAR